jgi:Na+-driven multidrug efflux pump
MFILILSAVINIIADPLLIFGIGPFPRLEIAGAAIATVFARSVGMFITLYVLIKGYSVIQISFRNIKLKFDVIWRIIRLAVPGSLQMGFRSVSGVILMRIVALY